MCKRLSENAKGLFLAIHILFVRQRGISCDVKECSRIFKGLGTKWGYGEGCDGSVYDGFAIIFIPPIHRVGYVAHGARRNIGNVGIEAMGRIPNGK